MRLIKTIPIIVIMLLSGILTSNAQEKSQLTFPKMEWDFGVIKEDGGEVVHKFTFTNSGTTPIAIDRVNTSCGCTTPDYPKSLIRPGESAAVTVSFAPMGYPGRFSKNVVVVSGGGKYHDMLVISGDVIPRVKSIDEEYPIEIGGGLRIDNSTLAFRQIAQGKASSMTVSYINTSTKPIAVEIIVDEPSGLLKVHAPKTICAGCRGVMTLTYDLIEKEGYYGAIHDLVSISIDGNRSERRIYAMMIGVDNFETQSIEIAPQMTLSSQYHNFGEVRNRKMPYVFRITASNEGEETLHIRSVSEKPGVRASIRSGMSIAPGASLPFEIALYSDKYNVGELMESIIITTNDPLRTIREVRIAAKIK